MHKVFFVAAVTLTLPGCTKTITPSIVTGAPQLVIQGVVTDTTGPYEVSITASVGFYTDNIYPGVSGATVSITDDQTGFTDQLAETETPGMYATHALPTGQPGHSYTLLVLLKGQTYRSTSVMPQPVNLDSVSFDIRDTTQITSQANFQDPKDNVNYYAYSLLINGKSDKRFQTFEDRLSDGRYIQDGIDADTAELKRNDLVQLTLMGIDKGAYVYLSEAEQIAYSNENLVAPANPTSNISGGCLGYFSAQTVSSKSAHITLIH